MKVPFKRVAIFDPWLILERDQDALHGKDIEDKTAHWVQRALEKGADSFYLRLRGMPPPMGRRVIDETLHRAPKDKQKIILPFGWEDIGPEATSFQFSERVLIPGDFPENILKGSSCHTVDAVREAEDEGYDYVFFSPVFSTLTHPDRVPIGLDQLSKICEKTRIPVFALGGVTEKNEKQCMAAGAFGIAAIRMFM